MRKLIVKIPDNVSQTEFEVVTKMLTENYINGYPIFMFPGWEYEIAEISDPILILENSKTNKDDFISAMKNAKVKIME